MSILVSVPASTLYAAHWLRRTWITVSLLCFALITFCLPTWMSHHEHRFPVGVYVTVMGLVAAVMALHERATRGQKAAWVVLITALMVGEIRNLYTVDREQTKTFGEISRSLEASAKGLDNTVEGIRYLVEQGRQTMDRVNKALAASEAAKRNTQPFADLELAAIEPISPRLNPNNQMSFNVHYKNTGTDRPTHIVMDAKEYVGPLDDPAFEEKIGSDFDNWWRTAHHQISYSVVVGERPFFSFDTHPLTTEEVQSILSHKNTIYLLVRWAYQDTTGRWIGDNCLAYQDPTHDTVVGHSCRVHNNHRYRAP